MRGVYKRTVRSQRNGKGLVMIRSPGVRVLGMVGALVGLLLGVGASSAAGSGNGVGDGEFQRFVLVNTDPSVEGGPIAANGVIHARGTDIVLSEFKDRFEFPDGNVVIKHRPKAGSMVESFDPVTCLFTFRERGSWQAVSGSGAYGDVRGHGRYRALGQGFGCSETEPPEVFFIRIVARGSLSL
jgi:hypothetical protein